MRTKLWFTLSGVLVCSVAALVVLVARGNSKFLRKETTPTQVTAQRPSEAGPVQMIRFIVFTDGIYPRELTVDKGLVNVSIEDKTNIVEALVIDQVVGNQRSAVGQVRPAGNHRRGRGLVKLTPGRYEVYEASRPVNKSILIVKP